MYSDNHHQQKSSISDNKNGSVDWNIWVFVDIFLKSISNIFTLENIILCFQYSFSMFSVLSILFLTGTLKFGCIRRVPFPSEFIYILALKNY